MADEAIATIDPQEVAQKRRKAHGEIVYLEECPECHRYSVAPDKRGRARFCLKCPWVDQ